MKNPQHLFLCMMGAAMLLALIATGSNAQRQNGRRLLRQQPRTTSSANELSLQGSGRVIYVDCTSIGGDGSSARPYNTVTVAHAAARPGDTITIRGCNYPEVVRLSTAMTLRNENGTVTIGRFGSPPTAWSRLGCPSSSGADSDHDFITDAQENCVARYYHPVLILHEQDGERGWPSSVEWFLSRSRLLFSQCDDSPEVVLQSASNQTALVNVEHQRRDCDSGRVLGTVRSDQKTMRSDGAWFSLDPSDSALRGLAPSDGQRVPVYTHIYPNIFGGVNIQYWYFFPYNGTTFWHEGDWEHITVTLNENLEPYWVWYYHHTSKTRVLWSSTTRYINGTGEHPLVYIAEQSHASYESDRACDDGGLNLPFLEGFDECPNEHALWWSEPPGEPLNQVVYLEGGVINLGERGSETFDWERFGGTWGSESGNSAPTDIKKPDNPEAPLFKEDENWLLEAAPFRLSSASAVVRRQARR